MDDNFVERAIADALENDIEEEAKSYRGLDESKIMAAFKASCTFVGVEKMNEIFKLLSYEQIDLISEWGITVLMAGFHLGFEEAKMGAR